MTLLEERVAFLEGRLIDQSQLFADIRSEMASLRKETAGLRAEMAVGFRWLIGAQITTIVTIVATLLASR